MTDKIYTLEEVSKHNTEQDAWVVVEDKILDVTKFLPLHPAGKKILLNYAGKDATEQFHYFHSPEVFKKYSKLQIGRIDKPQRPLGPLQTPGDDYNGVPYGDLNAFQGWNSPYYTEEHHRFRKLIRAFYQKEITSKADKWDEARAVPRDIIQKIGQNGLFNLIVGHWPEELVGKKIVLFGEEFKTVDAFFSVILSEEMIKAGNSGILWGTLCGCTIGVPPLINHGSDKIQQIAKECLLGNRTCCLAITEPWAGSDVSGIKTTAVLSPCGKFYTVNGMKKWITAGMWTDYFTTAVVTDPEAGMFGVSLLVIDSSLKGVSRRKMLVQGQWASGTSFIIFENVQVPVEFLIGKPNFGFKYIMYNFNHERLALCMQGMAMARNAVEESMSFAHKRQTFGKKLIDHPVIRLKLANMIRQVEAGSAFTEQCIYSYENMDKKMRISVLSPQIALCKAQVTMTLEYCAREAVQIFGGLGYTRGGQGGRVERIYRDVKGMAIPGGSEEIMLDLGIRMTARLMPQL